MSKSTLTTTLFIPFCDDRGDKRNEAAAQIRDN